MGEISCSPWVSWGGGKQGSILCNWPVCLVAAGEDCISIQEEHLHLVPGRRSLPAGTGGGLNSLPLDAGEGGGGTGSEVPIDGRGTGFQSLACQEEMPPGPQAGHADVDGGLAKRSPREPLRLLSLLYQTGHCLLQPPALWLGLCGRKPQPTASMKGEETPWTVSVLASSTHFMVFIEHLLCARPCSRN